jgi:hypothetical protein
MPSLKTASSKAKMCTLNPQTTLLQTSQPQSILLHEISRWKIQANSRNGARTFTNSTAMWLYRISNYESQFPHYNKGLTITLWSTLTCNFTLMVKAACKAFNKNQNPRVWLIKTHCFTTRLSVLVAVIATTHVFPHDTLDYNWRFWLW